MQFTTFVLAVLLGSLLSFSIGCSKQEKEKEPVVSVQTTPAERSTMTHARLGHEDGHCAEDHVDDHRL